MELLRRRQTRSLQEYSWHDDLNASPGALWEVPGVPCNEIRRLTLECGNCEDVIVRIRANALQVLWIDADHVQSGQPEVRKNRCDLAL